MADSLTAPAGIDCDGAGVNIIFLLASAAAPLSADLSLYFRSGGEVSGPLAFCCSPALPCTLSTLSVLTAAADFMADGWDSTFGVGRSSVLSAFPPFSSGGAANRCRFTSGKSTAGDRLAGATAEGSVGACGGAAVPWPPPISVRGMGSGMICFISGSPCW